MEIKLVMFKSDGQRKDFPVSGPTTTLGRGEDCDLQVPLLSVSRRHCELGLTDQGIKAKDLGSSNGTYVNNKRISGEVVLKAGDRLAVGPVVFTVQIDGWPEEIRPVKTKGQKMAEQQREEQEGVADAGDVDAVGTGQAEQAEDVPSAPDEAKQGREQAAKQDQSVLLAAADSGEEEVDPISALEALADESIKDKEGKPPSK